MAKDVEVAVETTVIGDKVVFEFILPKAMVQISMTTTEAGARDAETLVTNIRDLILQSVQRIEGE